MMMFYHPDTTTQLILDEAPDGFPAGHLTINLVDVVHDERAHLGNYPLSLGQAIQVRDFLNRHIDELALKQAGSLAERSSDDPTQLAAMEEIPHTAMGGEALKPVRVPFLGMDTPPEFSSTLPRTPFPADRYRKD